MNRMHGMTPRRTLACLGTAIVLTAGQANAVVVYGGGSDAPANDTAPAGFEDAWARVGRNGNGTGVYLGNGFVLTAAHVNNGSAFAVENDFNYPIIDTAGTILKNDDNSDSDLRLIRVAVPQGTGLFGLDPLPIVTTSLITPGSNDPLGILIGTGVGQVELQPVTINFKQGFNWNDTRDTRWAELEVGSSDSVSIPDGNISRSIDGFSSIFKAIGPNEDGAASRNDSGAPLYYDNGTDVVLVGLTHSVSQLDKSLNNDKTFFSDLSLYQDQFVITLGDLDGDGGVSEADLGLVLDHYGQSVQAGDFLQGDADGDGIVGVNDLDFVLSRWGDGDTGAIGAAPALGQVTPAVPEPASALILIGSFACFSRRRR
ncbi:MAG: hypothetical protein ACE37H_10965 [Phycisphaeraceae bacterium]